MNQSCKFDILHDSESTKKNSYNLLMTKDVIDNHARWDRQTDTHTDIPTTKLNRPRGRCSKNTVKYLNMPILSLKWAICEPPPVCHTKMGKQRFEADAGEGRGCSTNTLVIHLFGE